MAGGEPCNHTIQSLIARVSYEIFLSRVVKMSVSRTAEYLTQYKDKWQLSSIILV